MPNNIDLGIAFNMPPADAVAYFKSKGFAISDDWHDVYAKAHAKAFTVARMANMDLLSAVRNALDDALNQGLTAKQFRGQITPTLKKAGWWGKAQLDNGEFVQLGSPYRLNNIYRTNLQTAYMSGRYRKMLANSSARPYWQYIPIDDGQTRVSHLKLKNKVFRFDDPIWQVIYPPNDWGCRCRVRALTAKQVQERGLVVENGTGYINEFDAEVSNRETGEIKTVPHAKVVLPNGDSMTPGIGWAYSPGQAAFGADMAAADKLGRVKDVSVRAEAIQALNNAPLRQDLFIDWVNDSFDRIKKYQAAKKANWNEGLKTYGPRPKHKAVVAFLHDDINQGLIDKGIDAGRVITLSEQDLAHAHSTKHQSKHNTATLQQYQDLPSILNNPKTRVYWNAKRKNLTYVLVQGDNALKVAVSFPKQGDHVVNIYHVEARNIQGDVKNGVLVPWKG